MVGAEDISPLSFLSSVCKIFTAIIELVDNFTTLSSTDCFRISRDVDVMYRLRREMCGNSTEFVRV